MSGKAPTRVSDASRDMATFLADLRERHGLTAAECLLVLTYHLNSDLKRLVVAERRQEDADGE